MTAAQRAYEAMCAAGYVGMSPKVIAGHFAAWERLSSAERIAWKLVADAARSEPMTSDKSREAK